LPFDRGKKALSQDSQSLDRRQVSSPANLHDGAINSPFIDSSPDLFGNPRQDGGAKSGRRSIFTPPRRTKPNIEGLERRRRLEHFACHDVLPAGLDVFDRVPRAVLAILMLMAAGDGAVEISALELMDLAPAHLRSIRRAIAKLEDEDWIWKECRPQKGGKHLCNVYRLRNSAAVKASRAYASAHGGIGWRERHPIKGEYRPPYYGDPLNRANFAGAPGVLAALENLRAVLRPKWQAAAGPS
jgi:hypothetical protein